ncbi:glycoside hydrolase family 43 protein [Halobaculum lipolyticum]|uniref:Family 43 glycosylhydrolase n=1 Tax=Halobaculum lipolyticum TaxID=3032001 RepID=A0ABD5W8D4_9EURY|nr:glycoside hydrolase family 43 protein [Halobaculum sp. DT31]
MEYTNPVIPGSHPDPSVTRAGDEYVLATSSFEYVPGVPLFRSRNLIDWTPIGHAFSRPSQVDLADVEASEGVFAPTIRYHDGTYYLVTTVVGGGGHLLVVADDPAGEWSDPVWIDGAGIDPDLFWDDGTCYLTYRAGEEGIVQTTLDTETGETGDERRSLGRRFVADYTEAPHLYERDGTYYLLVAEGGTHTNHAVCVARADSPTGPFVGFDDNPVLTHRHASGAFTPIQAVGHGDLVATPDGDWWLVFLGVRHHGGHPGWYHLGRETFLAPVEWRDGWPVVYGGDRIETTMRVDRDLDRDADATPWTTDGFGDALGREWNTRYRDRTDRYTLADGELALEGATDSLAAPDCSFLGRRQQHLDGRASVVVADAGAGTAGLAAVADERHHYALGVDGDEASLTLRVGEATERVAAETLPDGPVRLVIDATTERYRFSAVGGDGESVALGTARSKYLAAEVTGGFTGVYLGVYATAGAGDDDGRPARLREFAYGPA